MRRIVLVLLVIVVTTPGPVLAGRVQFAGNPGAVQHVPRSAHPRTAGAVSRHRPGFFVAPAPLVVIAASPPPVSASPPVPLGGRPGRHQLDQRLAEDSGTLSLEGHPSGRERPQLVG